MSATKTPYTTMLSPDVTTDASPTASPVASTTASPDASPGANANIAVIIGQENRAKFRNQPTCKLY